MNKKLSISMITAALLLSAALPGAAFAKDHHNKKKGIENALDHVKNERAREVLERNLERKKAKEAEKEERKNHEKDWSDAQIVAKDKEILELSYNGSDDADAVTQPLDALDTEGRHGSAITWVSSHPGVLSANGLTLNRPAYGSGDVTVTLTATISHGTASDTKAFEVVVKQQMTDAQRIASDRDALSIGYSAGNTAAAVTGPLTLPASGSNGSRITWVSSNTAVLSSDGKTVVHPAAGSGDTNVILTATLTLNGYVEVKTFTVTVKQLLTDPQKAAADKEALVIGYAGTDSAAQVTQKLTLPRIGANGSSITWYSSNPAVVSADGQTVVRPAAGAGDTQVVLTAYLTYNGYTEVKTFTVTVKQQLTDAQKVAADKDALVIGYASGDHAASVTAPITLPVLGGNGSTIIWWSSNPAVLSHDGKTVTRPAAGSGDVVVVMNATIINSSAVDTKSFSVIVKQR